MWGAGGGPLWRQLRALAPGGAQRRNPASGGGAEAGAGALLAGGFRALHGSAGLCGSKNLLKKFASKTKKKFWYDSPTLGSHLVYKSSRLATILKTTQQKTRKEDTIRKRVLNSLLYKAVMDLMSTCEISQEVYDLRLELTKVALAPDFSACRVYWNPAESALEDERIENILQKSAPIIRHHLITHQVLRNVPPIVFVKDKEAAAIKEIDRLLAVADFGPEGEKETLAGNNFSESASSVTESSADTSALSISSNLFGINHEVLNKQIMEYKTMKRVKDTEGIGWAEQQRMQLVEIQKQKKTKKKKISDPFDNDITPQKYLLDKYSEDSLDGDIGSSQDSELENELQEVVDEPEVDDGRNPSTTELK
uniref:Ribosome binding factor A n=1 Tax=Pelodiscus sinensis TaxID=13735 RepID=K7FC08_PELSI|nr:putative ribosome-binding factor A, mitochondrial isoform X1 [Pelodiscus sinensis]|eukprot:XP_014434466.1 putative ribosome-binding factor A, mitochondrial isoform X1 [Pelodiscus sinensis]